ncbi:hypothetical protein D9758_008569 [Tetrapyrgos nigripes]|uniref:GH16 domain-containing protein n=1 Tax=Tetrapyrgos nigripes TaxID=182062 RepID=A0A8H5G5X7_9AGAR|nr:hypothetical protein D9758_008569 [Tetrapyrgos nigripes]
MPPVFLPTSYPSSLGLEKWSRRDHSSLCVIKGNATFQNAFLHFCRVWNRHSPFHLTIVSSWKSYSSSRMPPRKPFQSQSSVRPEECSLLRSSSPGKPISSGSYYPVESRISSKFSLTADPLTWGTVILADTPEDDDHLHDPSRKDDLKSLFSIRTSTDTVCLGIVVVAVLALFIGYPIIYHFTRTPYSRNGGFNLGGANATGQVPSFVYFGLIDPDTPQEAYTLVSYTDSSDTLQLVFSDEFDKDGRTFYPGDDPFWEAVDLHYWGTNNLEWYDPSTITTRNGALEIKLSIENPELNHNMTYHGGMLMGWNKFCFTGGLMLASVSLPGANSVSGLWPAVWTLGNLGRAGYGASLEGMWPYSYDSCDVGTLPNQTLNGLPVAATENGDASKGGVLSYLQGQRLSRCTCPGESHPGPTHSDGSYVGRAVPEIDAVEAQVEAGIGHVSQSGQWGPYNAGYQWSNRTPTDYVIYNRSITHLNSWKGSVWQQAASAVSMTDQDCYELNTGCFSTYGFEYLPGFDDSYITFINNNRASWTVKQSALDPDSETEVSTRLISREPMYMIVNLGLSEGFSWIDYANLTFPTTMRVDWIRVYQHQDKINIGCDPTDFPTAAYINKFQEAYTNWNLTTWVDSYGQTIPKNRLVDQCN